MFQRAGQTDELLDTFIKYAAKVLHAILPDLSRFSIKDQILYSLPNDPVKDTMIPSLVLYGLVYGIAGYILAYWIFRRREL